MLGSQALETAIGLTLLFFVVALAVSAATETISRVLGKRGKDLERVIRHMIGAATADGINDDGNRWNQFAGTSVYQAARAASGRTLVSRSAKLPSYLSAKSFADAVAEIVDLADTNPDLQAVSGPLGDRIVTLARGLNAHVTPMERVTVIKAGLERWFDETMDRLEGSYKRWVTSVVFVVGFAIAVVANASTYHVASRLWQDTTTREAVVAAAGTVAQEPPTAEELDTVAAAADQLQEVGLPVGWDDDARATFDDRPFSWPALVYVLGWFTTGLLATLGAPFWFDLLTRLVSLREAGTKPKAAADDPGSATTALSRLYT